MRAAVALATAIGLAAGGAAAQAQAHKWRPRPQRVRVLPRVPLRLVPHARLTRVPEGVSAARRWPAAGSDLGDPRVRVLGQAESRKLGLTGVVFTVSSRSPVKVDYARFAAAIGG